MSDKVIPLPIGEDDGNCLLAIHPRKDWGFSPEKAARTRNDQAIAIIELLQADMVADDGGHEPDVWRDALAGAQALLVQGREFSRYGETTKEAEPCKAS